MKVQFLLLLTVLLAVQDKALSRGWRWPFGDETDPNEEAPEDDLNPDIKNWKDKGPYIEDEGPYIEDEGPFIEDEGPFIEDEGPFIEDAFRNPDIKNFNWKKWGGRLLKVGRMFLDEPPLGALTDGEDDTTEIQNFNWKKWGGRLLKVGRMLLDQPVDQPISEARWGWRGWRWTDEPNPEIQNINWKKWGRRLLKVGRVFLRDDASTNPEIQNINWRKWGKRLLKVGRMFLDQSVIEDASSRLCASCTSEANFAVNGS